MNVRTRVRERGISGGVGMIKHVVLAALLLIGSLAQSSAQFGGLMRVVCAGRGQRRHACDRRHAGNDLAYRPLASP